MLKMKLRNQKGFTLIEIIAVLVILGILAAVAVPKYLSLAADAERSAANAVVSELNGRASISFASGLLTSNAGNYPNFNAVVNGGWSITGPAANTPASISAMTRTGGSGTSFTSTWTAGNTSSPGYFAKISGS